MKKLFISTLLILASLILKAQTDSIKVKVIFIKTYNDGLYYKLKDIKTGAKYYTYCRCLKRFEEGEILVIAKPENIYK